jgi:Bacterial pre-peptidase C-terminal domain
LTIYGAIDLLILNKVSKYCSIVFAFTLVHGVACDRVMAKPRREVFRTITLLSDRSVYNPLPLPINREVRETLSDRDIPTGEGGFARDYSVELVPGDQLAIDVTSENFDTVVMLINYQGKTIGKNDDGPDGSSNSLLFTRIKDPGTYYIRIQGFGETSSGEFRLKVSKLKVE